MTGIESASCWIWNINRTVSWLHEHDEHTYRDINSTMSWLHEHTYLDINRTVSWLHEHDAHTYRDINISVMVTGT